MELSKTGLEFNDLGHSIKYEPLKYQNNSQSYHSDFYMVLINGTPVRPISSRYSPIKTETMVNNVKRELENNGIEYKNKVETKICGNRIMIASVPLNKILQGKIFETNLISDVKNELDYNFKGKNNDNINMKFNIVNSYDGWSKAISYFSFNRNLCNNEFLTYPTLFNPIKSYKKFKSMYNGNLKRMEEILGMKNSLLSPYEIKVRYNGLMKKGLLKRGVEKLLKPYYLKNRKISKWAFYNLVSYIISRSKTFKMDIRKKSKIHKKIMDYMFGNY